MGTRQIPVVVLAGFLGSGKTTLLNHLLRSADGTRIGAVVNDFGSIEIDAMTVAGQVDSMVSLGNGCLCCAVDTSDLDEMLDRLARPSARIDVIVVEASGLAEPSTLIRMILASENKRIVYGGLIEVVDAAEFEATRERHPQIDRHLGTADLVVLNKSDRIADGSPQELSRLLERIDRAAAGTPVVTATYGRVDPELLFDRRLRPERGEAVRQLSFDDVCVDGPGHEHSGHLHAAYDSVEFVTDEPVEPRRLMDFLDNRPAGLYRIKGFVHFGAAGHRQKYLLHAVGRFLRFYPTPWKRHEPRTTQLVMIGSRIDAAVLRENLAACTVSALQLEAGDQEEPGLHEEAGPSSMWGVLRFVQEQPHA